MNDKPDAYVESEKSRARRAVVNEELGILPPIEDKKGAASGEIAEARKALKNAEQKLRARIGVVEPFPDPDDDAYWASDWARHSTDELFATLIGAAAHLGALLTDTPTRRKIETSNSRSKAGEKSAAARNRRAVDWQEHALKMFKEIRDKHPCHSKQSMVDALRERWRECPISDDKRLTEFILTKERSGELPKKKVGV
jgi:hypothetical protein